MDRKFISKETKKLALEVIDKATNFGIFEPLEKPIYGFVIDKVLDKYGDKFVPDRYDPLINKACFFALSGDYEEAAGAVGEILDDMVNLEALADTTEKLIFVDGLKFFVRQIMLYVEKRKAS